MSNKFASETLIAEIKDPEVFIALKRLCEFLVSEAWKTSGDDDYDYAVKKTQQYKRDVEMLASIDLDVGWGQINYKIRDGVKIGKKVGDLNPWYEGSLTLVELLQSIEPFYELEMTVTDLPLLEVEFTHYYEFLRDKISTNINTEIVISFDNLHSKIQEQCGGLYQDGHYAESILKAYKVVFCEIKDIAKIDSLDGKQLAEKAFSLNNPLIRLNDLQTQSDRDEQQGFMMLFSGAATGIRNPKAHDLVDQVNELRTLQYLSFATLLMNRLDERK